jgi:hypothetical protein
METWCVNRAKIWEHLVRTVEDYENGKTTEALAIKNHGRIVNLYSVNAKTKKSQHTCVILRQYFKTQDRALAKSVFINTCNNKSVPTTV